MGILKWNQEQNNIKLQAVNISTKLAIRNRKKDEQRTEDIVSKEYQHLLDIVVKEEKTGLQPYRERVNLEINLKEGETVP